MYVLSTDLYVTNVFNLHGAHKVGPKGFYHEGIIIFGIMTLRNKKSSE